MKISQKLLMKYAMLPPSPNGEEIDVIIPPTSKVPEIKDLSEDEMKDWEDFIAQKKLLKDLDVTKDITDIGKEQKLEKELGTMPAIPKKKADLSPDALLKMCGQYCEIALKN